MIFKKKIVLVIPYFSPAWGFGGPVRLAYSFGKKLVSSGYEVVVITSDINSDGTRILEKEKKIEGMSVVYLPNLSKWLAIRKIFLPLGLWSALKKYARDAEIIHCFDYRTVLNIYVWLFSLVYKKKYLVSVLGQIGLGDDYKRGIKKFFDFFVGKRLMKDSVGIISQSSQEDKEVAGFSPNCTRFLLPLAIDEGETVNLSPKGTFRKKIGLSENDEVVMFLGRINRLKGIEVLINSFAKIVRKDRYLVIAGRDDGYLNEAKKVVEKLNLISQVIFVQQISGQERFEAYQDADLFAFTPIYQEETSLACLEAMFMGTPLLVAKTATIPFFEQYRPGIEIVEINEDIVSREIEALLSIPKEDKLKLKKRAKDLIRNHFVLGTQFKQYLSLLQKVKNSPKKILHVIPHFFPSLSFGGPPIVCDNLAKEQVKRGSLVDILTTDVYSSNKRQKIKSEREMSTGGYGVYRLANLSNWLAYKFKFVTPWKLPLFLWRHMREYDIIHLHEYRTFLNVGICFFNFFGDKKIFFHPHGTVQDYGIRKTPKKIFDLFFRRLIYKNIDCCIAVSEMEKAILAESGIAKNMIKVLYSGIEINFHSNRPKKNQIVYIGRLSRRKGVNYLIEAFLASHVYDQQTKLIIIGNDDGELKKYLSLIEKENKKKWIEFRKPVNPEERNRVMGESKLVVYVTDREVFGLVPLEAAATGTWSIFSEDSGVGEVLKKYNVSDQVRYGDVERLTEKIKIRINQPKNISEKTRKRIIRENSWNNVQNILDQIYYDQV